MSAGVAPGDIIIAIGIAGHDSQQHEHDRRDAAQGDGGHQETVGGGVHESRSSRGCETPLSRLRERVGVRAWRRHDPHPALRATFSRKCGRREAQALATNRGSSAPVALGVTFRLAL